MRQSFARTLGEVIGSWIRRYPATVSLSIVAAVGLPLVIYWRTGTKGTTARGKGGRRTVKGGDGEASRDKTKKAKAKKRAKGQHEGTRHGQDRHGQEHAGRDQGHGQARQAPPQPKGTSSARIPKSSGPAATTEDASSTDIPDKRNVERVIHVRGPTIDTQSTSTALPPATSDTTTHRDFAPARKDSVPATKDFAGHGNDVDSSSGSRSPSGSIKEGGGGGGEWMTVPLRSKARTLTESTGSSINGALLPDTGSSPSHSPADHRTKRQRQNDARAQAIREDKALNEEERTRRLREHRKEVRKAEMAQIAAHAPVILGEKFGNEAPLRVISTGNGSQVAGGASQLGG